MPFEPPIWLRWTERLKARKPWHKAANRALSLLGLAYLALLAFPGFLFAHHVSYGPYEVYSDEPIGPGLTSVLDRASAKLAQSPLADPGMEHRIYLCNGRALRTFLSPVSSGAFGSTYPWLARRNTVLNRTEIGENVSKCDGPKYNRRPLDSVVAHERTHALIGRRFGDLKAWTIPEWKVEGYCEYVAGGPSFDEEEGKRLIAAGGDDGSASFRYFRYGLMVRHLLDIEKVGVPELFDRTFDPDRLMSRVRSHLNNL